jgi:hypothetical protein
VPLVGWVWAEHPEAEASNGTTWGSYAVTGTHDGERLTVTAVETDPPPVPDPDEPPAITTPCEVPAGGWVVLDPATTTIDAQDAALAAASAEPDYVSAWLDYLTGPSYDENGGLEPDDPTQMVLNVQFTGELERHEAELRELWGGPLCVSSAPRTEAELLSIMDEVIAHAGAGFISASPEGLSGTVEITVALDDGSLQAYFDQAYGAGVVAVSSALQQVG